MASRKVAIKCVYLLGKFILIDPHNSLIMILDGHIIREIYGY